MSDQPTPEDTQVVEPTSSTPAATSVQPENWEKRYKGLQRNYEKLQQQYNQLTAENDKLVADMEALRVSEKTLGTGKSALEQELAAEKAAKADLESKLSNTSKQVQRAQFIAEKFPQLMPLERLGSLPQADTTEELETKLTAYVAALEGLVGPGFKDRAASVSPSPSGNGTAPKRTVGQVMDEMNRYAGSTKQEDRDKFDKLRDELDELTTK